MLLRLQRVPIQERVLICIAQPRTWKRQSLRSRTLPFGAGQASLSDRACVSGLYDVQWDSKQTEFGSLGLSSDAHLHSISAPAVAHYYRVPIDIICYGISPFLGAISTAPIMTRMRSGPLKRTMEQTSNPAVVDCSALILAQIGPGVSLSSRRVDRVFRWKRKTGRKCFIGRKSVVLVNHSVGSHINKVELHRPVTTLRGVSPVYPAEAFVDILLSSLLVRLTQAHYSGSVILTCQDMHAADFGPS